MIAVMGDCHGFWAGIEYLNTFDLPDDFILLQVGDFGFYPNTLKTWKPPKFPVYAIDGNHENHEYLSQFTSDVNEVAENLYYIRRGAVLEFDGKRLGFLGGACSVDRYIRQQMGDYWSPLEVITPEDTTRLLRKTTNLNYLITHTPPESVIRQEFVPLKRYEWGLPKDWVDESSKCVEYVWQELGRPFVISGHMHAHRVGPNFRILDINEIYTLPT